MKIIKISQKSPYYKDVMRMIRDFFMEEHLRCGGSCETFDLSIEQIENNLEKAVPKVSIIIGLKDSKLAGYALFSTRNFCAVLGKVSMAVEDWYIKPEFRGHFFSDFIKYLARVCVKKGYHRIEWWVNDSNVKLVNAYKHYGAEIGGQSGIDMFMDWERILELAK